MVCVPRWLCVDQAFDAVAVAQTEIKKRGMHHAVMGASTWITSEQELLVRCREPLIAGNCVCLVWHGQLLGSCVRPFLLRPTLWLWLWLWLWLL